MITKRETKYVGLALSESAKSTYSRVKIGTVIVRGNKLVSSGANLCTSHPQQRRFNDLVGRPAPAHALHSELHAIVRAKGESLHGCHLYVARLDRRGLWADSKPCPACTMAIRMAGVARVTYTTPQGIKTCEVSEL